MVSNSIVLLCDSRLSPLSIEDLPLFDTVDDRYPWEVKERSVYCANFQEYSKFSAFSRDHSLSGFWQVSVGRR